MKLGSKNYWKDDPQGTLEEEPPVKVPTLINSDTLNKPIKKTMYLLPLLLYICASIN